MTIMTTRTTEKKIPSQIKIKIIRLSIKLITFNQIN